jgi:hypothetical protein
MKPQDIQHTSILRTQLPLAHVPHNPSHQHAAMGDFITEAEEDMLEAEHTHIFRNDVRPSLNQKSLEECLTWLEKCQAETDMIQRDIDRLKGEAIAQDKRIAQNGHRLVVALTYGSDIDHSIVCIKYSILSFVILTLFYRLNSAT